MVHRYNVDTQIQLFHTPWAIVTFTVGLAQAQPNYILCQSCLIAMYWAILIAGIGL